eukprot:5216022-Lingulodinium_polyedra.AAC.1
MLPKTSPWVCASMSLASCHGQDASCANDIGLPSLAADWPSWPPTSTSMGAGAPSPRGLAKTSEGKATANTMNT